MAADIVKQICKGTRRRFTAEDKIQIVLEAACEATGVDHAPVRKRPRMVTDRGLTLSSADQWGD